MIGGTNYIKQKLDVDVMIVDLVIEVIEIVYWSETYIFVLIVIIISKI